MKKPFEIGKLYRISVGYKVFPEKPYTRSLYLIPKEIYYGLLIEIHEFKTIQTLYDQYIVLIGKHSFRLNDQELKEEIK